MLGHVTSKFAFYNGKFTKTSLITTTCDRDYNDYFQTYEKININIGSITFT